jgi:TonB family protein
MYFDLDDHRPDTPRVPDVISRREGVLLSLLGHLALVLLVLFPPFAFAPSQAAEVVPPRDPVRFVEVIPRLEPVIPIRPADVPDRDDRRVTPELPKELANPMPLSRGDSPDPVTGGKAENKPNGAETSPPVPADTGLAKAADSVPVPKPSPDLSGSLRNLKRYLEDQNFDNPRGGQTDLGPDIQFDSKGVDFGPWLRRFRAQVYRNWLIPMNAMSQSGRVVITFNVMRDGTIRDLQVVRPSPIASFNDAAFNALRMSNPTVPLPAEYPTDRAFFTVIFRYNDGLRRP